MYDRHPRPSALSTYACGLLDATVMTGAAHATRHSVVVKDADLRRTLRWHFEALPHEWRLRVARQIDDLQFDRGSFYDPMEEEKGGHADDHEFPARTGTSSEHGDRGTATAKRRRVSVTRTGPTRPSRHAVGRRPAARTKQAARRVSADGGPPRMVAAAAPDEPTTAMETTAATQLAAVTVPVEVSEQLTCPATLCDGSICRRDTYGEDFCTMHRSTLEAAGNE